MKTTNRYTHFHYISCRFQSTSALNARQETFELLQHCFQSLYKDCRLYEYGSSCNGLSTNASDLDVTLVFNSSPNPPASIAIQQCQTHILQFERFTLCLGSIEKSTTTQIQSTWLIRAMEVIHAEWSASWRSSNSEKPLNSSFKHVNSQTVI